MRHPKNRKLRLADLLADKSFIDWVHQVDGEARVKWAAYWQQNPHQQALVADAALIVRGIPFAPNRLPPQVVEQQWQQLRPRLQTPVPTRQAKQASSFLNDYQYAALTFFSILVGAMGYWYFKTK
ncbi:hypothetical protein [Adhaeribacter pallidiroseus]|uniref:Uncharacterized protein n=1 Tax=Adhaeribacter pallidiroseus TaxID=2072847 RepID=A0A369QKZ7_9BACT|nr:hypothetical protein [Adhaeribacter pallidiroseus]RDC65593.1 hypothetical protein AHMF7616_04223 [Adhaeribacter pallidiroseus]